MKSEARKHETKSDPRVREDAKISPNMRIRDGGSVVTSKRTSQHPKMSTSSDHQKKSPKSSLESNKKDPDDDDDQEDYTSGRNRSDTFKKNQLDLLHGHDDVPDGGKKKKVSDSLDKKVSDVPRLQSPHVQVVSSKGSSAPEKQTVRVL